MNYRRVLLLHDAGADRAAAEALVTRIAPAAELLAAALPADVDSPAVFADVDLVVADHLSVKTLSAIGELRKRTGAAVLWNQTGPGADHGPLLQVWCVAVTARATAATAAFLREYGDASLRARVGAAIPPPGAEDIDLIVVSRFPGALLPVLAQRAPVLILPPIAPIALPLVREIDAADMIDDGGVVRSTIRYAAGAGRREPIPDQPVVFLSRDTVIATATSHDGQAELAAGGISGPIAVRRFAAEHPEVEVDVIRAGSRPLVLFDAMMSSGDLARLASAAGSRQIDVLAVRLRPIRSCRWIRARLMRAMLPPRVVDASAVLDEGSALDVGMNVDAVRLARAAVRMRAAGFPIVAIVHCATRTPQTTGFVALHARDLETAPLSSSPMTGMRRSLAERLDDATTARSIGGNTIELELDNAKARRWLLGAIAAATNRIHLQLYMAADDDIGRTVEAALAEAAGRGVTVRVVVDSLHGLEGSFGMHNPLLQRLSSRHGVELRLGGPIIGAPSLEEFKQRDHRKLAVFDGTLALLGGRNLSHEYYSGFDEVALTPKSLWRDVPWLDAGARVEGPAVAALERSFLDAWTAAGGAPFDTPEPSPAGSVTARVITHHGLRDACTLDAYLAMFDDAQSHVVAVNGFPLILEIQHALLRALRRGIRVRTLFGNLTPMHDGQPFEGAWSSARVDATNLVHSRMDALVAAGAEAYELVIPRQDAWLEIGDVHPHVHAKIASVDGRVCAVGSANLDVTAGYWENEMMLLVEDSRVTTDLEARIEQLIARSQRVDRDDPKWQEMARRRQWMRHWPGVMSI